MEEDVSDLSNVLEDVILVVIWMMIWNERTMSLQ